LKFIATLTKEVADEENPEAVRMLGALIFKNFIANRGGVSILQEQTLSLTANFLFLCLLSFVNISFDNASK